jgi:hypothetical protein
VAFCGTVKGLEINLLWRKQLQHSGVRAAARGIDGSWVTYKRMCFGLLLAAAGAGLAGPSAAADLGGNCCADLEERIAELESTTARKGNRKVSLTVSGWINEALGRWHPA